MKNIHFRFFHPKNSDFVAANDENITTFFIHGIKVLHFEIGLGWDHFLSGVAAQSGRREASSWTFLDRLDIFSDAIDLKNTQVLLFLQFLSE